MSSVTMHRLVSNVCLGLSAALLLSGCVVRTYSVAKDRVDQELTGNQGYLSGSAPQDTQQAKKFTQRTTKVVEIELRSPIKFERLKKSPESTDEPTSGAQRNKDLGSIQVETSAPIPEEEITSTPEFETYIVQKDDTLQKISEKIYGTTKKWKEIFEANQDTLKSPDKIRPGKELRIPKN